MSLTYIKWARALKAQGISRDTLHCRSRVQPWAAYYALGCSVFVTLMQVSDHSRVDDDRCRLAYTERRRATASSSRATGTQQLGSLPTGCQSVSHFCCPSGARSQRQSFAERSLISSRSLHRPFCRLEAHQEDQVGNQYDSGRYLVRRRPRGEFSGIGQSENRTPRLIPLDLPCSSPSLSTTPLWSTEERLVPSPTRCFRPSSRPASSQRAAEILGLCLSIVKWLYFNVSDHRTRRSLAECDHQHRAILALIISIERSGPCRSSHSFGV